MAIVVYAFTLSPQRPQISNPDSSALPARTGPIDAGLFLFSCAALALVLLPGDVSRQPSGQNSLSILETIRSTSVTDVNLHPEFVFNQIAHYSVNRVDLNK
jgi:hypothetical protein